MSYRAHETPSIQRFSYCEMLMDESSISVEMMRKSRRISHFCGADEKEQEDVLF